MFVLLEWIVKALRFNSIQVEKYTRYTPNAVQPLSTTKRRIALGRVLDGTYEFIFRPLG